VDLNADGLGPVYNAQLCRECHQDPISGAASQIHEFRTGHREEIGGGKSVFVDASISINNGANTVPGRNLINDRAITPNAQELVSRITNAAQSERQNVRTNRLSLNVLGDGFVEALDDATLVARAMTQCHKPKPTDQDVRICGQFVLVPVLEQTDSNNEPVRRVGRFGWKDQHASLLSFSADAYLNEMGVTNSLLPDEVTTVDDPLPTEKPNDPADPEDDIHRFARFMRSTKVPPPNVPAEGTEARKRYDNGQVQFTNAGCTECHVPEMTTSGGDIIFENHRFDVSPALRNKRILPFSDFLLHNVGTGDGIVISVTEHYGMDVGGSMFGLTRKQIRPAGNRPKQMTDFAALLTATKPPACTETPSAEMDSYLQMYAKMQCFANFLRTPPLWGIRVRSKLMHDGQSVTVPDAIRRHDVEAKHARLYFENLLKQHRQDADDLVFFVLSQ